MPYSLEDFTERYEDGLARELTVADQIRRLDIGVALPGVRLREDREDWRKFAQTKDLFIALGGHWIHCEVKSRPDIAFSAPHEYPYDPVYLTKTNQKLPRYVFLHSGLTKVTLVAPTFTEPLGRQFTGDRGRPTLKPYEVWTCSRENLRPLNMEAFFHDTTGIAHPPTEHVPATIA